MSSSLQFFLGFLALVPLLVSAQNGYMISKIDVPTSSNGTATIVAGNFFLSFVNYTEAPDFVDAVGWYYSEKSIYSLGSRIIVVAMR
jgi:hypothetical protein